MKLTPVLFAALFFAMLCRAQPIISPISSTDTNAADYYPQTNSVTLAWRPSQGIVEGYYIAVFTNATDFTNGVLPNQLIVVGVVSNSTVNLIQYTPGYLFLAMQAYDAGGVSGWSNEIHWPAYPAVHVGDWITVINCIQQSGDLKEWRGITNEVLQIYVPANGSNNYFRAAMKNITIKADFFQPP